MPDALLRTVVVLLLAVALPMQGVAALARLACVERLASGPGTAQPRSVAVDTHGPERHAAPATQSHPAAKVDPAAQSHPAGHVRHARVASEPTGHGAMHHPPAISLDTPTVPGAHAGDSSGCSPCVACCAVAGAPALPLAWSSSLPAATADQPAGPATLPPLDFLTAAPERPPRVA